MEILLTGANGRLGSALWRAWSGIHELHTLNRDHVDFRHPEELEEHLEGYSFDALVNCISMSNPEDCELWPAEAHEINCEAPAVLAEICQSRHARMVHFSTDYVLDGRTPGLKDETAPTNPLGHYALSKLDGERHVLHGEPSALVCRLSWVFGTEPPGFMEEFLLKAEEGEALEAICDKHSMPTWAHEIADIVIALLDRRDLSGVFHVAHLGEPQSQWSCGSRMLELACEAGLLDHVPEVRPQPLAEVPHRLAPRPLHTAMKPERLIKELRWPCETWEDAVRKWLERLVEERS